jgi:CheY-like chemotaxis protein
MVREVSEFALHGSTVKGVYDLPEDLWPVDADKGQIGRVVQNLVINALQAMPDGGVVHISASNELESGTGHASLRPGEYVHFVVRDSGVGIKAEHLPRIFDPYFTTKQTGSGLGLAAAYSIVKKHRGLIEVESECGRGTTFHVRLPALRGLKADREPGLAGRIATFQGRVLFMDDDPSIRLMATALMPRLGLEIMAVSDGREAIRAYQAAVADGRPFSLVIMDLTVPGGMGGREAIERLREIDPAVKAIVSSGYSSDPVLANYRDYGFCGLISKPCDLAGYTRAIGKALGAGPG